MPSDTAHPAATGANARYIRGLLAGYHLPLVADTPEAGAEHDQHLMDAVAALHPEDDFEAGLADPTWPWASTPTMPSAAPASPPGTPWRCGALPHPGGVDGAPGGTPRCARCGGAGRPRQGPGRDASRRHGTRRLLVP